jgi:site-specific DNA-cytosine methylase
LASEGLKKRVLAGGTSCTPLSDSGKRLGRSDRRILPTIHGIARVARRIGPDLLFIQLEQVMQIYTIEGGGGFRIAA